MRADIPSISFKPAIENLELEIVKVEELFSRKLDRLKHDPQQPHRPSFNILLLPMEGKGKHMVDFQEYSLEAGDVLVIAKGQVHAFEKSPQYKGYLLLFTEDFILHYFPEESLKLLSRLYNYHIGSPLLKDQGFVQALIDEIARELAHDSDFAKNHILAALLSVFLLRLERENLKMDAPEQKQGQYDVFNSFRLLVEKNFSNTRNGLDYAEKLSLSYKSLNKLCKGFTGKTAKQFIDDYLMLEAKRNLLASSLSVKEISYKMGFDELSNFVKFFKKHLAITPHAFREQDLFRVQN
ncbi:MAG: helix-turn-helix transcriptional regulator [Bacteroidota bacterium]